MFRLIVISIILLFAISFTSCEKTHPTQNVIVEVPVYPNAVGTYWTYVVVDSSSRMFGDPFSITIDTIRVSIVDTITLPGISTIAKKWVSEFITGGSPGRLISEYYVVVPEINSIDKNGSAKDTVKVFWWRDGSDPWLLEIFIYPLNVGDAWKFPDEFTFDSTNVYSREMITLPTSKHENSVHLRNIYSCGDECGGRKDYWYKEGVGLLRSHTIEKDIQDGYESHRIREMIDNNIVQ